MSNINLLPWRETKTKQKIKGFYKTLICYLIFTLTICCSVTLYIERMLAVQIVRIEYLNQETHLLVKKIKLVKNIKKERLNLEQRINLIQLLDEKQNDLVHLLNILPKVVPNGVYLNSLLFDKYVINVEGVSDSNKSLAKMMRSIEQSSWLENTFIRSILAVKKTSKFSMRFSVKGTSSGIK